MSEFKYLKVVEDGTEKIDLKNRKDYRILDYRYGGSNYSLVEPLHGVSPELASQKYLYDNPREFFVLVSIPQPENKYESFEIIRMARNPAIQKSFHDAQDVQSSEF